MTSSDIVLIIGALALGATQIITSLRQSRAVEKAGEKTAADIAGVAAQASLIAGHVDGAASKSVAKIDSLEEKILALHQQLFSADKRAAVLAQATSDTAVAAATVAPVAAPADPGHEPK
jgi:hypothetical protein